WSVRRRPQTRTKTGGCECATRRALASSLLSGSDQLLTALDYHGGTHPFCEVMDSSPVGPNGRATAGLVRRVAPLHTCGQAAGADPYPAAQGRAGGFWQGP